MNGFRVLAVLLLLPAMGLCRTAHTPGTASDSATPDFSRYRLEAIHFEGARAFSPEQLTNAFGVSTGGKFNSIAMRHGFEGLRQLYGDNGYINFTAVPTPRVEQDKDAVIVTIRIDEGSQFTFGKLFLTGQEARAGEADALRKAWVALSGKRFDSSLLNKWLSENATFLPNDGQPPSRHVELHQSSETHQANIGIRFPGPKS
jgi:hypothetical protein